MGAHQINMFTLTFWQNLIRAFDERQAGMLKPDQPYPYDLFCKTLSQKHHKLGPWSSPVDII